MRHHQLNANAIKAIQGRIRYCQCSIKDYDRQIAKQEKALARSWRPTFNGVFTNLGDEGRARVRAYRAHMLHNSHEAQRFWALQLEQNQALLARLHDSDPVLKHLAYSCEPSGHP